MGSVNCISRRYQQSCRRWCSSSWRKIISSFSCASIQSGSTTLAAENPAASDRKPQRKSTVRPKILPLGQPLLFRKPPGSDTVPTWTMHWLPFPAAFFFQSEDRQAGDRQTIALHRSARRFLTQPPKPYYGAGYQNKEYRPGRESTGGRPKSSRRSCDSWENIVSGVYEKSAAAKLPQKQ